MTSPGSIKPNESGIYKVEVLDIGYSPALRDPAGRGGILGVEMSSHRIILCAVENSTIDE